MRRFAWILLAAAVIWTVAVFAFRSRSRGYVPAPPSPEALAARVFKGDDRARTFAIAEMSELAEKHPKEAIPVLCKVLAEDPQPFFRARAAESLGRIGDKSVLPDLAKALRDESETTYSAACWAIGRIGDPQGVETLRPNVVQETDEYRALKATFALHLIRGPSSEDLLLKRIVDYPISVVSLRAAYAIAEVGTERTLDRLVSYRAQLPEKPMIFEEEKVTPLALKHDLARALDEAIRDIRERIEQSKKGAPK